MPLLALVLLRDAGLRVQGRGVTTRPLPCAWLACSRQVSVPLIDTRFEETHLQQADQDKTLGQELADTKLV